MTIVALPNLAAKYRIEYKRRGYAVADEEHLTRIAKVPRREFMRRGINQHTLEKICKGEPVRAIKLAECLRVLEDIEVGAYLENQEQETRSKGLTIPP